MAGASSRIPSPVISLWGSRATVARPTFLLLTGYEQVRSIAAHLAGDHAAADNVRLVLPETGVCNATLEEVAPRCFCCSDDAQLIAAIVDWIEQAAVEARAGS